MTGSSAKSWVRARLGLGIGRWGMRVAALAVALALGGGGIAADAQQQRRTQAQRGPDMNYNLNRECFAPLNRTRIPNLDYFNPAIPDHRQRLQAVVSQCSNPAPRAGLAYSYYYAAKANRILGEAQLAPMGAPASGAGATELVEAQRLLEVAAGMASAPGGDAALLLAAKSELARVFRLQVRANPERFGERYNDARRVLDEVTSSRFGQLDRALLYERAMLAIQRDDPTTPDDDSALLPALQDLQVFANRDTSEFPDLYVQRRGPIALATLATRLGNQVLARPPSLDNTQAALRLFNDAVRAYEVLQGIDGAAGGAASASTYVDLGMLNLRLAALLGTGRSGDVACGPGAEPRAIDAAERAFSQALVTEPQSVDANWGRGCALRARGNPDGAAAAFSTALANLPSPQAQPLRRPRSDYYLAHARAQATLGNWDGPNGALTSFDTALSLETDNNRRADILVSAADVYLQAERPSEARRALDRALGFSRDNAGALMTRAQLLICGRADCSASPIFNASVQAQEDLTRAREISGGHQATANYLLSKVLMERGRAASGRERTRLGTLANQRSAEAYLSDRSNIAYRSQACLTRIIFGDLDAQGQSYCLAEESGPNYGEALFFEGVYWMRRAYFSSGGNQEDYWGRALGAFERGADFAGSTATVEDRPLSELLAYGRRFALYCAGLDSANAARPGDAGAAEERQVFARYELARCWR